MTWSRRYAMWVRLMPTIAKEYLRLVWLGEVKRVFKVQISKYVSLAKGALYNPGWRG